MTITFSWRYLHCNQV